MNKIFVLEGADGTGKSTLANYISEILKANIIHCSYDKTWDIKEYHEDMYQSALKMAKYNHVILDRWSLSEFVYGMAFRDIVQYDVIEYMYAKEKIEAKAEFIWIYCRNDDVIENHIKNQTEREEMFNDMTNVIEMYDTFVENDSDRKWYIYDFNVDKKEDFINKIIREN